MASILACPPPPYSRTSVAEPVRIGSAAKQEVPGPEDLQAWELGAVTETVETENTYRLITSIAHSFYRTDLYFAIENTLSLYF